MVILSLSFFFVNNKLFSIMLNMWTVKLYIFIKDRIDDKEAREFDTLKSKKVPQSLEIGLFFCQIFIFII